MVIDKGKDYFIFFIGLICGIRFRFVGIVYLSEIVMYISCAVISWWRYKENPYVRNILFFGFLWLIGCVFSDLYNETDFTNSLKGAFNIIFFLGLFPFVYWALYDKPLRYLYYWGGCAFASLPNYFLFHTNTSADLNAFSEEIFFVYALVPIFYFVLSYIYYKNIFGKYYTYLIMIVIAIWMLFHNSRNVFLTMSMSTVLLYYIDRYSSGIIENRLYIFKRNIYRLCLYLFVGLFFVSNTYETLASEGILGREAYNKYMRQAYAGNNLLEGGRSETFMGLELCLNNPIIGYGSYAKDHRNMFRKKYSEDHGIKYVPSTRERLLPSHSHVVGYWLYHGILGLAFWLYVLILIFKIFKSGAIVYEPKLSCLFVLIFTSKVWDIMFSPFGSRVDMCYFIVFLIILQNKIRYEG